MTNYYKLFFFTSRIVLISFLLSFFLTEISANTKPSLEEVTEYKKNIAEGNAEALNSAARLMWHYDTENKENLTTHYAQYVIDNGSNDNKDEDRRLDFLNAHRKMIAIYFNSAREDSLSYYVDLLVKRTEGYEDKKSLYARSFAYLWLAKFYLTGQSRPGEVYPLLRKASDIAKKGGHNNLYLSACYDIGQLYLQTEPDRLVEFIEEIEDKAKTMELSVDGETVLLSLRKVKVIHLAKKSTDPEERIKALGELKQILQNFKGLENIHEIAGTAINIATYFEKELDKDSLLHYAKMNYDLTKELNSEYTNNYANTLSHWVYGRAFYVNGKYEKAIKTLTESLPYFYPKDEETGEEKFTGNYGILTNIYSNLSLSYMKTGDTDKAGEYLEKYGEAMKKHEETKINNIISESEAKFKISEKEAENNVLKSENALISSRFKFSLIIGFLLLSLTGLSLYFFLKMRKNKQELERINAGKNQLFAILAHDLKDPVSSFRQLTANISYLIKQDQPERLLELAKYYESAGNRINFILVNLLDWAISQKDQFVHKPQELKVKSEVSEILKDLEYALNEKGIKVKNRIAEEKSMTFDKNSLKVIVRNLVHNAVKFSEQDSTILIDYDDYGLKVKDTGIGIPSEIIKKIKNNERVESRTGTNHEKGNGIGLSTCVKLAKQNNAELKIDTKVGEGTTFTLVLNS